MPVVQISFPLQVIRQQAEPVDVDEVFLSLTELNAYLTSPRRFAGQIASIKSPESKLYILNAARSAWIEVGTGGGSTAPDIVTLLSVDGLYAIADTNLVCEVVVLPTSDLAVFKMGYTVGGDEIIPGGQPVTAAEGLVISLNKYAIPGGSNTIHFTGVTSDTVIKIYKK